MSLRYYNDLATPPVSQLSITPRTYYFAYGSNMCRARLEARVGGVRDLGAAPLDDYIHRFTKPGGDGTAKGNIERRAGSRVLGVLYEITGTQLEVLATHEGGYRRMIVPVRELSVVTFTAVAPGPQSIGPTDRYLSHYRRGIEEHGIGLDYFEALIAELS